MSFAISLSALSLFPSSVLNSSKMADYWKRAGGELGKIDSLVLPSACRRNFQQIKETYQDNVEDQLTLLQNMDWSNQKIEICKLLSLWMLGPQERDAVTAKSAFINGDINYKPLVEIFCGRKSSHFLLIRQAYQTKFRRQLDQDITSAEPPSPYQKILIALATSHNSHEMDVSQHIAKCDARRLHETGGWRQRAIEEAVVLEIFSKRNIPQLKLTFSAYKQIYGHDYTKSLKKEATGEFGDALRNVVRCLYTPAKYYTKILYECIKGKITDKSALMRVIVNRADTDLEDIKAVFKTKHGMELKDAICDGIPSGDCRDFLVVLASRSSS